MTEADMEAERARLLAACDQNLNSIPRAQQPEFLTHAMGQALSTLIATAVALPPALVCYFFVNKDWSVLVFCAFVIYIGIQDLQEGIAAQWVHTAFVANKIAAIAYCVTNLSNQVAALRNKKE